jgi:hypothetical protein
MVAKYPNAHAILYSYAMFLDSCKSDAELAERYMRKSDELRIIEEERNDLFASDGDARATHSEKNGLVTTSSDGLIETIVF